MSETIFLTALQQVTDKTLSLTGLIEAATALTQAGQPNMARQLYNVWIAFNRDDPRVGAVYFNMSVLCTQVGEAEAAAEALKRAIDVSPGLIPPYINLGGMLERGGSPQAALDLWKSALAQLEPVTGQSVNYKIEVLKQTARVLLDHQRMEETEAVLRQCLELSPQNREVLEQYMSVRLVQCKWPAAAPLEGLESKDLLAGIHPLSACAYTDDPLLQLSTGARYARQAINERKITPTDRRRAPVEVAGRRIRVGYVSSDLREHAIGYLMAELFELHDRDKVEVFAYYCGRGPLADLHERIKSAIEHWRDIREMSDDEAAAMIAADQIDILVDVNGHTKDSRTGVFARRSAPIQVNWLGFPGSMGSPYHHYIIADPFIIPEDSELYYSEKVLRLPCYQPNDRRRVVAPAPTRTEVGLPEDTFVFCCFNGAHKFTRFVFERWMEILKAVPDSVLWLLEGVPESGSRLKAYAKQYGVEPDRLVFAPKKANPFHLARYPLADLFLDTIPYGAHTTASDAIWMGVPVLTMVGRSFASRVCGSLVSAAGLPELICDTTEDYVAKAIAFGHNRAQVEALKARLEANRATCDLFNMDQLTERLEALYARMCDEYAAGALPRPDLTNLEAYFTLGIEFDHEGREMTGVADYIGLYKSELARLHSMRPIPPDQRIWTTADIEAVDAPLVSSAKAPRKRAAR